MISNLRIKNFVLIDDLDIDFSKGFNVLFGETGAGKSILVNALTLLSGARSQFDKLNDEKKKAIIEATFILDDDFISDHEYLKEYLDDNVLVLTRILSPNKISTLRINGETVTLYILKRVANDVFSITSQGEQISLMNEKEQLNIVDKYVNETYGPDIFNEYDEKYNAYKKCLKDKEEFLENAKNNDIDIIRFKLEEIEKYNIKENEIEYLENYLNESNAAQEMIESGKALINLYNGNIYENFADELTHSLNMLNKTSFADKAENILEKWNELSDLIYDLTSKFDEDEYDEEQIEKANERIYELNPLIKKYGHVTQKIFDAKKLLEDKIGEADNFDASLKEKEEKVSKAKEELIKYAEKLSKMRQDCKKNIVESVNNELSSLGLLNDGFDIQFNKKELSNDGIDVVKFVVRLNKGKAFESLSVAASGGEKSRLMIALIASFNKIKKFDTLIFDEVDTGISGNIALVVGKKIREIAKNSSVIAVSHLPSVVAAASNFYLVYKNEINGRTISHIKEIGEEEKIKELSKMLGGEDNIEEGKQLALKLIRTQTN